MLTCCDNFSFGFRSIISSEVVEQLAVVAPYSLDLRGGGGDGAVARRAALGRPRLRLPRCGPGGRASGAQGLVHDVLPPQHIRQELLVAAPTPVVGERVQVAAVRQYVVRVFPLAAAGGRGRRRRASKGRVIVG